MPVRNIVIGQNVKSDKVARAKELRASMTDAEKTLWNALRANRLDGWHFRRQQVIDGFIVDFYCHAAALVIEVDGEIHETQKEADVERDHALTARGFRIQRFTNDEVQKDLPDVLKKIKQLCSTPTDSTSLFASEKRA